MNPHRTAFHLLRTLRSNAGIPYAVFDLPIIGCKAIATDSDEYRRIEHCHANKLIGIYDDRVAESDLVEDLQNWDWTHG